MAADLSSHSNAQTLLSERMRGFNPHSDQFCHFSVAFLSFFFFVSFVAYFPEYKRCVKLV